MPREYDAPSKPHDSPVQVVFIGGSGRSGSTLVEQVLDQDPTSFAVGELDCLVFRPGVLSSLCGCDEPVGDCDVWREVLIRAFGSIAAYERSVLEGVARRAVRMRRLPLLLSPVRPARYARDFIALTGVLERLYRAIRSVTGTTLIVDASKSWRYGHVLARMECIDLRVIHLVRDARGVAYSFAKAGLYRPQTGGQLPTFRPAFVALSWSLDQALVAALPGRARRVVLRYEDLAWRGSAALTECLSALELGDHRVPQFAAQDTVRLRPGHGIFGNPMRVKDEVRIRIDEEWRVRLPRRQALVTTVIASPLLLRYGYLGHRPPHQ